MDIASCPVARYLSGMSEKSYDPFDEGKEHPKVGCGAVNCCHSCDGPHEKESPKSGVFVVLGALVFLLTLTTLTRYLLAR